MGLLVSLPAHGGEKTIGRMWGRGRTWERMPSQGGGV